MEDTDQGHDVAIIAGADSDDSVAFHVSKDLLTCASYFFAELLEPTESGPGVEDGAQSSGLPNSQNKTHEPLQRSKHHNGSGHNDTEATTRPFHVERANTATPRHRAPEQGNSSDPNSSLPKQATNVAPPQPSKAPDNAAPANAPAITPTPQTLQPSRNPVTIQLTDPPQILRTFLDFLLTTQSRLYLLHADPDLRSNPVTAVEVLLDCYLFSEFRQCPSFHNALLDEWCNIYETLARPSISFFGDAWDEPAGGDVGGGESTGNSGGESTGKPPPATPAQIRRLYSATQPGARARDLLVDWVILRSEPGWLSSFAGREIAACCPAFIADVAETSVVWQRQRSGGDGNGATKGKEKVEGARADDWNCCAYHWHDAEFAAAECCYAERQKVAMPTQVRRRLELEES